MGRNLVEDTIQRDRAYSGVIEVDNPTLDLRREE